MRERYLTLAELFGFGAVTVGATIGAHMAAGFEAAIGAGLSLGGAIVVYLANAYAGPGDAER